MVFAFATHFQFYHIIANQPGSYVLQYTILVDISNKLMRQSTESFYRVNNLGVHPQVTYTLNYWDYTSSTAQGGGGSFKNRKPIGEVGCCESGMAERSH